MSNPSHSTSFLMGENSHPPASTEQDRFNSLFNILRDHEEFTLNTCGIVLSSNLEAVHISGYEEWEVIGKPLAMFYTPHDRAAGKPQEDLNRAVENGRAHLAGWRVKKKGKNFWAKTKIQALFDEEGTHTGFKVTVRDASHNVLYNYRVKNIRSEYLALFNNSFIGIFKYRFDDGRVLIMNEKAVNILHCDSTRTICFNELFHDPDQYLSLTRELVRYGKADGFEFQLADENDTRWVTISCKHFSEGNFVEGIVHDITQSKKQVIELQRLNHELDQFIYHASHDLRSPLTSVLGLVNLIHLEKPNTAIASYANMIQERMLHLDTLLKDIVALTDHNKGSVTREVVSLEEEAATVLKELCPAYPQVHVLLAVSEPVPLCTDARRLRVILRHLISNGLKYHNPTIANPTLKIEAEVSATQVRLVVEDNGIGIPQAYQKGIFELFFKAAAGSGSGLGLYLVKQLVADLGGSVQVASTEGCGATFSVWLPNNTKVTR